MSHADSRSKPCNRTSHRLQASSATSGGGRLQRKRKRFAREPPVTGARACPSEHEGGFNGIVRHGLERLFPWPDFGRTASVTID